ncbi:hypothetical protein [Asticcacaulis sp. AC402]|uniref:hypothetical protein n=1 Tax=Asticcacaulis sp. AC402 TaxID=1282361 RepID=UPI0003C3D72A|nr:hypothetical protein [Asticcacaulis sp. AC402]ESQ74883.1 hypothetical protein ABAC402_12070 [Asticcacaulis sp. AC402]
MSGTPGAIGRDIALLIVVVFALVSGGSGYLYYQASGDWDQFPVVAWLTFSGATAVILVSFVTFLWSLKFFGLRMITVSAWYKGEAEPFLMRTVKFIVLMVSLFFAAGLIAGSYLVIEGATPDEAVTALLWNTLKVSGVISLCIVVQEAVGRWWRHLVPKRTELSS